MKKLFFIFLIFLFYFFPPIGHLKNIICEKTGSGCPEINYKEIISQDGVYYKKFTSVPFTGKTIGKEIGLIEKGKKEGFWVGYHDNGKLRYSVNFKNGKREIGSYNGIGTFTYSNGDKYVGELKDGKKYGLGASIYGNGSKYRGEYKEDKVHGQGTFTYANGQQGS